MARKARRGGRLADARDRRLLLTGCARSGTTYMSVVLRRCGFDITHEKRMGDDGICSWLFASESSAPPWGPVPDDFRFDHTIHLVRHPLSAIPSIATLSRESWEYVASVLPLNPSDPPLLKAARYWLHWNALVEERGGARLVRIEDMPARIDDVLDPLGVRVEPETVSRVPTDLNTRRHGKALNAVESKLFDLGVVRRSTLPSRVLPGRAPSYADLTWDDLARLDTTLVDRIRTRAVTYGYAVPKEGPDHG